MSESSNGDDTISESEIRDIVREEVRREQLGSSSRRRLLGALGALGAAGIAGCGFDGASRQTDGPGGPGDDDDSSLVDGSVLDERGPSEAAARTGLVLQDNGSRIDADVRGLNFRRNLSVGVDGGLVTLDARPGVEVVGSGGDATAVSRIELGAGLDASVEDGTLTVTNPENQTGNGRYQALQGDVQSALDDAFEDGVGAVTLAGGATYEFDSPVEVPPGVALDCTGARVALRADVNAFEAHTQSRIVNPSVRTTDVDGYSSSVFHVYPQQFGEAFGTNRPVPVWTVSGGWTEMTPGEGTCIELHGVRENPSREYDVGRDNRNVYFCFVAHNCTGGRRFAYLHREGGDTTRGGHVNGNVIQGFAENATRFVETDDTADGKNMVNGNKFHLVTQPGPASEWLWYANKGRANELYEWGHNWDYARYSDADGDGYPDTWYIGPNAGTNYVWRKSLSATGGLGSTVVDDSDGESGSRYLVLDRLGVPVEELSSWEDAE